MLQRRRVCCSHPHAPQHSLLTWCRFSVATLLHQRLCSGFQWRDLSWRFGNRSLRRLRQPSEVEECHAHRARMSKPHQDQQLSAHQAGFPLTYQRSLSPDGCLPIMWINWNQQLVLNGACQKVQQVQQAFLTEMRQPAPWDLQPALAELSQRTQRIQQPAHYMEPKRRLVQQGHLTARILTRKTSRKPRRKTAGAMAMQVGILMMRKGSNRPN